MKILKGNLAKMRLLSLLDKFLYLTQNKNYSKTRTLCILRTRRTWRIKLLIANKNRFKICKREISSIVNIWSNSKTKITNISMFKITQLGKTHIKIKNQKVKTKMVKIGARKNHQNQDSQSKRIPKIWMIKKQINNQLQEAKVTNIDLKIC